MPVKIYYNEEIHKLSVLPTTLPVLVNQINHLFRSQLPPAWIIQHLDVEGDLIMIMQDLDYEQLLDSEMLQSSATIKLVITAVSQTSANAPTFGRDEEIAFAADADKLQPSLLADRSSQSQKVNPETFGLTDLQVRILQQRSAIRKFACACRCKKYPQMAEYRSRLEAVIPELALMLDQMVSAVSNAHGCGAANRVVRGIRRDFMAQFFPDGGCRALRQLKQYQKSLNRANEDEMKKSKKTDKSGGWFYNLFRKSNGSASNDSSSITRVSSSSVNIQLNESAHWLKAETQV